jgi:hypothetical protein
MTNKAAIRLLLVPAIILATVATSGAAPDNPVITIPPSAQILQTLKPGHPRLLMTDADFAQLKQRVLTEEPLRTWHTNLLKQARAIMKAPPSKYELPDGLRLLANSRQVLDRVQTLALLYRLDGDKRYADRAWLELDAAAHFKDWNPRHFLDTAEMTRAFAMGYDWLYDYWTPEQRQILRTAIVEKGIIPALKIEHEHGWWSVSQFNWNQVCNSGIGMGALAIADDEPQLAGDFLHAALQSIQIAMAGYGPDGAWPEGPGYWNYATGYNVAFLAALQTALGTDFGLTKIKGFSEAGTFPVFDSGPTGLNFNFADAHAEIIRCPAMFWLAREFNQPLYGWHQSLVAEGSPLDMIWYDAQFVHPPTTPLPLDKYYRHTEVVTMRSAWGDTNALFVGFKAGDNKANHSHLDLGTFVLDALGERWVMELGSDNYNLPGYFDTNGKRWLYYRLRAEGNNTLVINPTNGPDQNPRAWAPIVKFESNPDKTFAIADLTEAYAGSVQKAERGVEMLNRNTILIQDEIETIRPSELWWFLHTQARVKIAPDGSSALLTQPGKRLLVTVVSPTDARFTVLPPKPLPTSPHPAGQNKNKGVSILAIHLENVTSLRLVVRFTPFLQGESAPAGNNEIKALSDW